MKKVRYKINIEIYHRGYYKHVSKFNTYFYTYVIDQDLYAKCKNKTCLENEIKEQIRKIRSDIENKYKGFFKLDFVYNIDYIGIRSRNSYDYPIQYQYKYEDSIDNEDDNKLIVNTGLNDVNYRYGSITIEFLKNTIATYNFDTLKEEVYFDGDKIIIDSIWNNSISNFASYLAIYTSENKDIAVYIQKLIRVLKSFASKVNRMKHNKEFDIDTNYDNVINSLYDFCDNHIEDLILEDEKEQKEADLRHYQNRKSKIEKVKQLRKIEEEKRREIQERKELKRKNSIAGVHEALLFAEEKYDCITIVKSPYEYNLERRLNYEENENYLKNQYYQMIDSFDF